jgi:hypothetical protein
MYIENMKKKLITLALVLSVIAVPIALARGLLLLDKYQFDFAAKPNTIVQSVIKLTSGATFDQPFNFTSDSPWLTATPSEGTIEPKKTIEIKIRCDTKSLEPNTYMARGTFTEISQDPIGGSKANFVVNLRVYEENLNLDFIPRSLETKPGQTQTVVVKNSNDFMVNLKLKSNYGWINVIPQELEINPKETSAFLVKVSEFAPNGGLFRATVKLSTEAFEAHYPISCFVDCGVAFNPPELSKPGVVILTNKSTKIVFVELAKNKKGATTEPAGKIKINPKESKTIAVNFPIEKDKKPDILEFKLLNSLKKSYIMEIK